MAYCANCRRHFNDGAHKYTRCKDCRYMPTVIHVHDKPAPPKVEEKVETRTEVTYHTTPAQPQVQTTYIQQTPPPVTVVQQPMMAPQMTTVVQQPMGYGMAPQMTTVVQQPQPMMQPMMQPMAPQMTVVQQPMMQPMMQPMAPQMTTVVQQPMGYAQPQVTQTTYGYSPAPMY